MCGYNALIDVCRQWGRGFDIRITIYIRKMVLLIVVG